MDETALAFEHPHARASATHAGPPLDRISVRDYVRDIEIGAFRSERGVTQRLRFNVVLEVAHHAAGDDDVDRVVSYDTITDAIEAAIAAQRMNLLETLAERVAAGCLADPRTVRAFVRVEKLDRVPGALGVEIMRTRFDTGLPRLRPVRAPLPEGEPAPGPTVLWLPAPLAALPAWREAAASFPGPLVTVVGAGPTPDLPDGEPGRQIGLLALDQAAWRLAGADPRFEVVGSRTELDWAARTGRRPVWAPSRMVDAGPVGLEPATPEALAAWLAADLGATLLVLAGSEARPEPAAEATGEAAVPLRHLPAEASAALAGEAR